MLVTADTPEPQHGDVTGASDTCSKNRVGSNAEPWQAAAMNDYERIAEAIRFLDAQHAEQPDLATLSARIGLSPSHFHRLFSAWAGATPKDFLQCLTLSHARSLLLQGESVLDAALGSGLSGPGRLHDLCVTLDAASPGEIKSKGAGLTIHAGFADSPFGNCLIGETARGICHLSFFERGDEDNAITEMRSDWPLASVVFNDENATRLASIIFASDINPPSSWKLFVRGTPFQLRVWRALLRVPPGALVSYGKLAAAAGNPNASRATGSAVGGNAISYLIPCHRVIRETGVSGHYRWGATRKRAILAWEGARADAVPNPG
jgi:AraC family transcriptional regulator of adaptative response/methylated-DNA-[protein]-cysteine methyltransferase